MNYSEQKYYFVRSLAYLVIFIILHYLYDFFPVLFLQIISGTDESLYQHLKIGFYSYLILFLVELIIFWKKIPREKLESFIFGQLFASIIISWFIFIFYYSIVTFIGHISILIIEIIYSILITYICCLSLSYMQKNWLSLEYSLPQKIIIILMLVFSIIQFTWFTFSIPEMGFFFEPQV